MTSETVGGSLYERLGGEGALTAAIDLFYAKVLGDPLVAGYFDGVDMTVQRAKAVAFFTLALGGPDAYRGRDLRSAHAPLVARGLGDEHFNAIAGHLVATLEELGVAPPEVQEAVAVAESVRGEVLGR